MDVGGSPAVRFWRVTLEQQQDNLLAAGLLTQTELADSRALLESPEYRWLSAIMMSVWGRRPSM